MAEINLDATLENLEIVNDFVAESLDKLNCSMQVQMQIDLIVEEVFVNIASYAYKSEIGKVKVICEVQNEPPAIVLTFIDSGIEYNPLEAEEPDINLPAEERKIGGLGIFMVKKFADEMAYERVDGKNVLRLKKNV